MLHDCTADMVIAARDVTLTLGGTTMPRPTILRGIDLDVARGTSVALLGPSGSGKSSLMAVLSGLERASGGQVEVAGLDFGTLDEDALARARRGRIGIVLQAFHLLPTMTARENVAVPMELAGMADAFARAEAELRAVGLATGSTIIPRNCRAASSSASRSPARWGRDPRWSSPTSRPAISTPRPGRR